MTPAQDLQAQAAEESMNRDAFNRALLIAEEAREKAGIRDKPGWLENVEVDAEAYAAVVRELGEPTLWGCHLVLKP